MKKSVAHSQSQIRNTRLLEEAVLARVRGGQHGSLDDAAPAPQPKPDGFDDFSVKPDNFINF